MLLEKVEGMDGVYDVVVKIFHLYLSLCPKIILCLCKFILLYGKNLNVLYDIWINVYCKI